MDMSALNWIDYVIIGILVLSTVISLVRGLVREALSLASWIIAIWVGIQFSKSLSQLMVTWIHNDTVRLVVSFFILFAVTLIIGALVSYLMTQLIQKTGLSGTDRVLGSLFGLGRGALVVALIVLVGMMSHFTEKETWKKSVLIPSFKPLATWMHGFLPENKKSD